MSDLKKAFVAFCVIFTSLVGAAALAYLAVQAFGWFAVLVIVGVVSYLLLIGGGQFTKPQEEPKPRTKVYGSLKRATSDKERIEILVNDPAQRATPHARFKECPCWNCQTGVDFDQHCREQGYVTGVFEFLFFPLIQVKRTVCHAFKWGGPKPFVVPVAECSLCPKD